MTNDYKNQIVNNQETEQVILPLRDGLTIIRKNEEPISRLID